MTTFRNGETRPFRFGYGPAVLQRAEYTDGTPGSPHKGNWSVSGAVDTTTSVTFNGAEPIGRRIKLTITVGNNPKFVDAQIV